MKLFRTVGAAALLIATSQSAFAQASAQLDDEIVVTGKYLYFAQVTALKSPTPILDVPQSLTILTSEDITNQGFDSMGDIINYIPGVTNSQGEGHRDAVVFRGVRSTADFFVDGVRDDVQYYRGLYNIDQVEVLRGANALLFGRGGTGGLINRVTKKGQIGEQFTGYKASLDSFGAFGLELDSNYTSSESTAFRVNAMYESLNNHRDFYEGERIAVNPTARFALTPRSMLDVSYEYIDNQRTIDRGIPTGADGRPVEALKDITFGDPEVNTTELQAHILRATLTQDFSDHVKGVFNATYGDYDKMYQNFYASDYDPLTNIVTLDGYRDTTQRANLSLSGNLIGQFATGDICHTVVSGIEYSDTSNNNDRYNTFFDQSSDDTETFFATRPLGLVNGVGMNASGQSTTNNFSIDLNDDTETDVQVFSAYIQNEMSLSDKFDVVLGARFDSFDITSVDMKSNPNMARSRKDEEFSPRLGLIYKPKENISLYGSFSQSFLPRSGGQYASLSASTAILDPDVFENLEAGLKWDFAQDLSFTAAYFQNDQTRAARDDVNSETFEIRGLEIEGFELQLNGQLTDKLYFKAGYANLSGETDEGRERPRELPKNTFSLWTTYQFSDKLGLGLGATHQGKAYISDLDIGSDASTHPTLPSYTRFDAAAFYDVSDDLRLQVNVENLTDTLYFPTSHSTHQVSVGSPLHARFTISGRF